jgi:hypothetical protein
MAPRPPAFLIFAGLPDGPAVWLEVVYGLDRTKRRMREIAAENPGTYFIRDMELTVRDGVDSAPTPSRAHQVGRRAKGTAA